MNLNEGISYEISEIQKRNKWRNAYDSTEFCDITIKVQQMSNMDKYKSDYSETKTSSLKEPQVTPHPGRETYLPNYGYFPVSP